MNIKLSYFRDTLNDAYELSLLVSRENIYLVYNKKNGSCYLSMDDISTYPDEGKIFGFINGEPFMVAN